MSRTVRVLAAPSSTDLVSKSLLEGPPLGVLSDIDFDALKAGFEKLTHDIADLFPSSSPLKGYGLKQIQVGVEVSSEGGVHLIGSLVVGGKAAITLTFERH